MLFPVGLLLFLLMAAVVFVPWVLALVDSLRRPDPEWDAAGQSKLLWVLVIALLGILGAILYFVIARPALVRAQPHPFGPA